MLLPQAAREGLEKEGSLIKISDAIETLKP
jgi:hypothetical protein